MLIAVDKITFNYISILYRDKNPGNFFYPYIEWILSSDDIFYGKND